jgi:lysophospholipase L1-like esterase
MDRMTANHSFARLLWWACLPAVPLLLLQAKGVRKRVPRLPEAAGSRRGESQVGPSLSTLALAIVGESTAVGVGADTLNEALPGHLGRALAMQTGTNVTWHVMGGNGMTVECVLSSVSRDHRYDAAVVLLGVNDVFRLTPIKVWLMNLRLLAKKLEQQGCPRIVFSAVPPVGQFPALPQPLRTALGARAALLDHHLEQLARELPGAAHCKVRFPTDRAYIAADGVHPSNEGYRHWAQQLAATISARLLEAAPFRSGVPSSIE